MGSNTTPPGCGDVYSTLLSRRVDLIGDYAGNEPFLLDGDSLLLHCFADERLDFQGKCCALAFGAPC